MSNSPNAANITHALAQLGGGSKKDGGGGMLKGFENVFKFGIEYGIHLVSDGQQSPKNLEVPTILSLGDGSDIS